MNKRHYEHTLPNIRGSLSNTYFRFKLINDGFPLMTGNVLTPKETIIPLTYP